MTSILDINWSEACVVFLFPWCLKWWVPWCWSDSGITLANKFFIAVGGGYPKCYSHASFPNCSQLLSVRLLLLMMTEIHQRTWHVGKCKKRRRIVPTGSCGEEKQKEGRRTWKTWSTVITKRNQKNVNPATFGLRSSRQSSPTITRKTIT